MGRRKPTDADKFDSWFQDHYNADIDVRPLSEVVAELLATVSLADQDWFHRGAVQVAVAAMLDRDWDQQRPQNLKNLLGDW